MTGTTKLLELARKATPGVWTVLHPHKEYSWITASDAGPGDIVCCAPDGPPSLKRWPDTSAFIAAANPSTIIALVDHCERAEEQRDALLGAAKVFADFIEKFDAKPTSKGDDFYSIHTGTEWEAHLLFSDFRRLRAAIALCEPTEPQVTR